MRRPKCVLCSSDIEVYRIHFNFHGVKLSWFARFHVFRIFTFAVAEPQAGEIKPCVSFRKAKLSQMVSDPRKTRKFKRIRYWGNSGTCPSVHYI